MKLSICLAAYNGEKFIKEQIESIIPQIKEGDEFLIADDGSEDGTLTIIEQYSRHVSKIISGPVNGVNNNFERLLLGSKNEGIVLADQDDVWLAGRLDKIRTALESSSLVMTNGVVVDEELNPLGPKIFEFVGNSRGLLNNLYKNTYVGCCMAFRRDLISNFIPFDAKLHAHDWLIGLLGELDGKVIKLEDETLLYRRHHTNASETGLKSSNSLTKKIIIRLHMMRIITKNINVTPRA